MELIIIALTSIIIVTIVVALSDGFIYKEILLFLTIVCIIYFMSIGLVVYGQKNGATYIKYVTNNKDTDIDKTVLKKKVCVANPYMFSDTCKVINTALVKNSDIESLFFQE